MDKETNKKTGWHYSSDYNSGYNSTKFTNCCGSAVTGDDTRCPECGAEVEY